MTSLQDEFDTPGLLACIDDLVVAADDLDTLVSATLAVVDRILAIGVGSPFSNALFWWIASAGAAWRWIFARTSGASHLAACLL